MKTLKTVSLLVSFLSIYSGTSHAEGLKTDAKTNQKEVQDTATAIIGGAGGFVTKVNNVKTSNFDKVFKDNGFSSPSSNLLMFGGKGFTQLSSGWRVGGAGYGGSLSEVEGDSKASYTLAYGGLVVGKAFEMGAFSLVPEILIGGGGAGVEVFSEAQNASSSISGLVLEPAVNFEYRLFDFFSIAASASYMKMFEMGAKSYGDNIDVDLNVSDFSYSIQLLFGKFI